MLDPEAVRRGNHVVANGPVAALHVNGNDLPVVVGFNLVTDVPLVYFVAKAGRLLSGTAWRRRRAPDGLRGRRRLRVPHAPPFRGVPLPGRPYQPTTRSRIKSKAYVDMGPDQWGSQLGRTRTVITLSVPADRMC